MNFRYFILDILTGMWYHTLCKLIFLDSSMVEHSAVNRVVVGSSPTQGAFKNSLWTVFLLTIIFVLITEQLVKIVLNCIY